MKRAILIVFLLMLAGNAFATAQFPDELIYQEKRFPIFSNPLESYFTRDNPRPRDLFPSSCTACWRGYVATWTIKDGFLHLLKLVEGTCSADAPEISLAKIFPGQERPIKATWFSGTLKIPQGKQLRYVHMGYGSVYEKEWVLEFEKGKLTREYKVDNTQKRLPSEEEKSREELEKLRTWEEKSKKGR